ncbi:hypothetical protein ACFOY8_04850 [Thalassospira xianhensis]|uniref:Uncharacterized protein n=1 Tax=Thalassospira xianhensis MCCC 1A02616 TaxID=1177929 RepID=A0A367UBR4_9PROT|nr:hypothetical protein [Thalassospira xianhensis]RCK05599.1 hypothetical protein TH5_13230 [Thalassospira xianhensis MCCC 1A02616]UKV16196.1 hypothetical protein L6172_07775 [Thalassospiraceae bacterium SW-3-3]
MADNRSGGLMTDTILAVLDDIDAGLATHLATKPSTAPSSNRSGEMAMCDLRIVRSLVLLWSGQNAALTGDNDDVRQWIMDRLPDITERLERIDAHIDRAIDDDDRNAARQMMFPVIKGGRDAQ